MASVDVVGVRRSGGGGSTRDACGLVVIVEGMAGLTAGTPLVLSHCARPEFAFALRDGEFARGYPLISRRPEKLCKTTWQDVHYQARPVVGGLRPAAALGTLIGKQ
jgi:hypothetical protein